VPVWHAFYVYVAPKNALEKLRQAHTSATYVLDGQGRERVLMTSNPDTGTLVRDLRILLGLTPQAAGADSVPAPQAGHPAPAFQLRSLSGSTVRLHDLRGHVVVLNFWATWCTACRSEMPMLARWSKAVRSSGVVVLGIDQQESARDAAAFVRRYRVPYPILLDSSGDVSATYGVAGLPTSLVVDRHGMVHAVRAGILDQSFLTKDVMPLARSHE
jgi:peroxiredoxin